MLDMFGSEGAAPVMAATTLVYKTLGCLLGLSASPLYRRLGLCLDIVSSILGYITLAVVPVPTPLIYNDKWLWEKSPLEL